MADTPATQTTTTTVNSGASNNTPSPSHSQATSTPAASPALKQQQTTTSKNLTSTTPSQAPQSTTPTATTATLVMPWSLSTIPKNTPSPVTGGSTTADHRTNYYCPRPVDDTQRTATPITHHPYMYQPPSNNGVTRNVRENGK